MLAAFQIGALAVRILAFSEFDAPMLRLMAEAGIANSAHLAEVRGDIRTRNQARLRQGELDHLVNYVLQSGEFTKAQAVVPARAAVDKASAAVIARRVSDFVAAARNATGARLRYFGALVPADRGEDFIHREIRRVLEWTREKEVACRTASDPQRCVAELYQTRGHSSDTGADSNGVLRAALGWLGKREIRRVLLIGPGVDIAGRTGGASGRTYQPQFLREALQGAVIDCVDLNPRVVQAVSGVCSSAHALDIAVETLDTEYDLIVATNVLLYLNQQELMLAFANIGAMLAKGGSFVHNDARFEANVFGRAVDMPVAHFGTVTLDATRRPVQTDRFVIHSRPSAPTAPVVPR